MDSRKRRSNSGQSIQSERSPKLQARRASGTCPGSSPVPGCQFLISAVLIGAGNHINVVVLDILHKLLCDDEVVVVKMNPQNAFLGPFVHRALAPFFDSGFARLVYGDIDAGVYLCQHPLVDNIHLTGSVQTFNQITYGTDRPTKVADID